MALFLIERNFAEQVVNTAEGVRAITEINNEIGVHWLFSFLSADKKKSYCLYEAPNPETVLEAARRAGVPADVIIQVDRVNPEAFA